MADIRQTRILDNFDRLENPLSNGGRWRRLDGLVTGTLQATGNPGLCNLSSGLNSNGHMYWAEGASFDGDFEVWAMHGGTHDDGSSSSIGVFQESSLEGSGTARGYYLRFENSFGGSGSGIFRIDAWPSLISLSGVGGLGNHGGLNMLRRVGSQLQHWRSADLGANWTNVQNATDSTYTTDMRFALGHSVAIAVSDTWDDIGGTPTNDQQIFRWLTQ